MARTKQAPRRSRHDYEDDDSQSGSEVESGDEEVVDGNQPQEEDGEKVSEEEKLKREELEKAPMRAEVKHLEKRWTKKGKSYFCEPQEDEEVPEQKTNWYEQFVLCVTSEYDQRNKYVTRKSLSINSPALKEALKEVIKYFPGISFFTETLSLDLPPRCLYHYRHELQAYTDKMRDEQPDSQAAAHMPILMEFINEHFADTIKEGDNLRAQGLINFDLLWTIFRPGDVVYSTLMGQPRAFKMSNYAYQHTQCGRNLQISCTYTDFDGDKFGVRATNLAVWDFDGVSPIADLSALPLEMHGDVEAAKSALIERGRKWEAHAGQHFVEYRGIALDSLGARFNLDCRTMIDCHTHHRINGNTSFTVTPFPPQKNSDGTTAKPSNSRKRLQDQMELVPAGEEKTFPPLTDEQAMRASPMVRGFSFSEKKFLDFFIDKVRPVDWNTRCFEQLVLPDSQKELVQALVSEHTQRTTDPNKAAFDDIVKGKGRGLILVLHGPPGVGKTLTAECVAEFAERPLYIVSSGDLGTSSAVLDEKLSRTLDLASTWKAVLLIDEADVFLERRSLHDLERNSLVSIFLRTLEYYSGILFMTTNRIKTFDDAFKSRIHVPLRYGELPADSRFKVWRNFLDGVEGGVDIDDAGCRALAEEGQLNGRQIKNVVRTAKSLAAYKKRRLDGGQLRQVMEIQMAFERDLVENGVEDEDIDMVER